MEPTPGPRRPTAASRLGLAVATLAAAGTFAAALLVAGLPTAPVTDAAAAAPTSAVTTDPSTGERVVVDTVYVLTPAPAAQPTSTGRQDGEHEDEHEGGESHEGHEDNGGDD